MTTEEILKLDTSNMSEETARAYGIDILENNLKPNQDVFKRRGSFALLFVSTYVVLAITETPRPLLYLSLFVAAVAVFLFCSTMATRWSRNRTLKQFRDNTFKDGYVHFLKEYQSFLINDKAKQEAREKKLEEKKQKNPERAARAAAQKEARSTSQQGEKTQTAAQKGKKSNISQIAHRSTKNIGE